jgi:SAM-dependent methyltransferase
VVEVPDFDAVYRRDPDPWRVASSPYEQRKLEVVLACLGRPTYQLGWDTACGTGHLARRLADRCERVLATDASPVAVELTSTTCADAPGVRVAALRLPAARGEVTAAELVPPPAAPDLVVLSEFLYYLDAAGRAATLELVDRTAAARAEVLAVHWRHRPDDAWLSGADTQTEILRALTKRGWTRRVDHREPDFVVNTLFREPGPQERP